MTNAMQIALREKAQYVRMNKEIKCNHGAETVLSVGQNIPHSVHYKFIKENTIHKRKDIHSK